MTSPLFWTFSVREAFARSFDMMRKRGLWIMRENRIAGHLRQSPPEEGPPHRALSIVIWRMLKIYASIADEAAFARRP